MSSCSSSTANIVSPSSTVAGTSVSSPSSTVPSSEQPKTVQEAARAWAKAYLTGTADDLRAMQGPECLSGVPALTAKNEALAAAQLRQMRADLEHNLGVSLASIKVTGVRVRNVTVTSGEAEVQYNFPTSVIGNDNWVTYELHGGSWKVADCDGPIGRNGSSGSVTTTTAP
jgi:hypothetical protein